LSSRPSDAIAIALRADAPIYVATELMNAVGVIMVEAASDDDEPENDLVDAFREFLDSIDPDDFQAS
jgi:bifunctional DNase/RNase